MVGDVLLEMFNTLIKHLKGVPQNQKQILYFYEDWIEILLQKKVNKKLKFAMN